jgi:hypothetical protein
LHLGSNFVSQLQWKVAVGRHERCNERILEGLDGPLSRIQSLVMLFNELELALLFCQECFDVLCGLVVHDVNLWLVPL